ncbi:CHAT domain-containing protein [Mycobacterium sp. CBMA 234]|uniref:CHAT domain-containing protein n=1 Tax=Mycolicibacterium sp. CBMA 234 TaxID=1918495 RepID=UPI0012DC5DA7|nr:CHAT domain-containing protein [Mycolicibacterium sp. CBMA 234]MUL63514.1 CHAT domain-containing protein [Mycolicibacterium sp. CBMA 234]
MSVTSSTATTLVLRFADVGIATYASLRVLGSRERMVTWVVAEDALLALTSVLAEALPDPLPGEQLSDALVRSLTTGPFSAPLREQELAQLLGVLVPEDAWDLLRQCGDGPELPVLFVSPSTRLSRVPWGLLAPPAGATDHRLIELADILLAVPPNIANAPRRQPNPADGPPVLVLDPKVPGQRPDSALGSVLGRPSSDTVLARHFAERPALPSVNAPAELFRRVDTDRHWLAAQLAQQPSRLVYVGHASAAPDHDGQADRAALHLAESTPLTAGDIMVMALPIPPKVALLACASGADYRFDEATGLVAAMILGGAQVVTATLWSLPTTAGYRSVTTDEFADPMSAAIIAVDTAHEAATPARAVNQWQRACLHHWRTDEAALSPVYWAALVTFTVDGAR